MLLWDQIVIFYYILNDFQVDPSKPVLVAGDPERAHMEQVDKVGGIYYVDDQIKSCNNLAEQLHITPISVL